MIRHGLSDRRSPFPKALRYIAIILTACAPVSVRSLEQHPALAGVLNDGMASSDIINATLGLVVVLAIFIVLATLFKRFGRLPTMNKGIVSILGGIAVGTRERVVIVKVEDVHLVLGVAPGRVEILHILNAPGQAGSETQDEAVSATTELET